MRHFCTLFDRNYLAKGLCLHESLSRHSSEGFVLHILAMDMPTLSLLQDMELQSVDLMLLSNFERAMNLGPVKASRSWKEYCWTAASQTVEWLLPRTDAVCYLDADEFLYADPKVIFDEMGDRSIAITPHRFAAKDRPRLIRNGEYNVGILVIKNTEAGRKCAATWGKQTREWCFNRNEDGKFGDQGYLDRFPSDYPGEVAIIKNLGVNLGPWSVGNFQITERSGKVFVNDDALVAYHFHEYQSPTQLTGWPLRDCDKRLIYQPYNAWWTVASERIKAAERKAARERAELELESQRV